MFSSSFQLFSGSLKGAQGLLPNLIEVGAQERNAFGIQLIEAAGAVFAAGNQARILEHTQMLRDGGPADGQGSRQLVHGYGAGGELLQDGHTGGVSQGFKAGLQVSIHLR